jgi:hypothetical protein
LEGNQVGEDQHPNAPRPAEQVAAEVLVGSPLKGESHV